MLKTSLRLRVAGLPKDIISSKNASCRRILASATRLLKDLDGLMVEF